MLKRFRAYLGPLATVYRWITDRRNAAFDNGRHAQYQSTLPTLIVGNLSMGGTGKTPMVEYLIRLHGGEKLGIISRGYGRKSKGLKYLKAPLDPEVYGDEPVQIQRKFPQVDFYVAEKRKEAMQVAEETELTHLLLDDAFQHRAVTGHFKLMLSTYAEPFFSDFVLPKGNLREGREGAQRADAIVFTKCPEDLNEQSKQQYRAATQKYSTAPVFFCHWQYQKPSNGKENLTNKKVVLISGLANPEAFEAHMSENYEVLKHFRFKDHHPFQAEEILEILNYVDKNEASLVCTEKDWVKISRLELPLANKLYYLAVEHQFFSSDQQKFEQLVADKWRLAN